MLPEYALQLVLANRSEDAELAIDDYLQQVEGKKPTFAETIRLNRAVNELAKWGASHSESYNRLRDFRDTGAVANQDTTSTSGDGDPELVADLKSMQGLWEMEDEDGTIELTIKGNQGDIIVKDAQGKVKGGGNARFVLSRSL